MRLRSWAVLVFSLAAGSALAEPNRVAATTWMRSAPSPAARVIDEVETGVVVSVLNCAAEWCEIMYGRARGYVPKALLTQTASPAVPVAGGGCFPASHFTPHGPVALTICPAAPR